MTASGPLITNTTAYPVFATKALFMTAFENAYEGEGGRAKLQEVLFRLSNTDTDNWTGDSTVRHDA